MKVSYLIVAFIFSSNCHTLGQGQAVDPCHQVLEHIGGKVYSGTPRWQILIDSAIGLCPTHARAWGDKAMVYAMRGDFPEWLRLINHAVGLDSLYFLGNRAWYRQRYLRDYEGALRDLLQQERLAGYQTIYVSSVHSHMLIGLSKQEMGDAVGALAHYDKAINDQVRRNGEDWVGTYDYLLRGILRFKQQDLEGALSDLNKQAKLYEILADTYYYRGLVFFSLGKMEEARSDLLHAKELLLGNGLKRWDSFCEIPDEIFLSDVEQAILKVY